jgi:hypothetical protein
MNSLIYREHNGQTLTFREDGYFNMTKAAKAFNKKLSNFWRSPDVQEYITALEKLPQIEGVYETTMGHNCGTWGHPKLAVFFARWLDPKFAVFCDMVIDDILSKKAELTITQPGQSMTMQVPQTFPEALHLAA